MSKKSIFIFCLILFFFCACDSQEYGNEDDITEQEEHEPENPPKPGISSISIIPGKLTPEFSTQILEYNLLTETHIDEIELGINPANGSTIQVICGDFTTDGTFSIIPVTENPADIYISASNDEGEEEIYSISIKRMNEMPVENFSFEEFDELSRPYSWDMAGAGNFITGEEVSHSGNYSAYFSSLTTSIGGREILSSPVEIEEGNGLILSAWLYLADSDEGSPERVSSSFKIYYYTDNLCEIPASTPYSTMSRISPDAQGVWERISWERSADQIPPDAKFIRIAIRACYNKDKGGTKDNRLYFDSISLQQ